jgi:hypothetical protein
MFPQSFHIPVLKDLKVLKDLRVPNPLNPLECFLSSHTSLCTTFAIHGSTHDATGIACAFPAGIKALHLDVAKRIAVS